LTCTPNLTNEHIKFPLDLPYYSHMVLIPNTRKIERRQIVSTTGEKAEENLFLYDPRKKTVALNWCCQGSEEIVVYLYNPLPFMVTLDSLDVMTSTGTASTHSGRIVLKANEMKKRITIRIKFAEEGTEAGLDRRTRDHRDEVQHQRPQLHTQLQHQWRLQPRHRIPRAAFERTIPLIQGQPERGAESEHEQDLAALGHP
jgi:hypothetical protein